MNNIFYKKVLKSLGLTSAILITGGITIYFLVNYLDKIIISVNQNQQLLATTKAERLSFVSLQNNFQKVEKFFPSLENALPDENNLYYIAEQMEAAGANTGNSVSVQITSSQVAVDEQTGAKSVLFSARLSGNYESFKNYLKALNSLPFFVKISSWNISGNPSVSNESQVGFSGEIFVR